MSEDFKPELFINRTDKFKEKLEIWKKNSASTNFSSFRHLLLMKKSYKLNNTIVKTDWNTYS